MAAGDEAKATIFCQKNGPHLVRGLQRPTSTDGEPIALEAKMALCRCGGTGKRPRCDGTHESIGFTDTEADDRVPDRRDTYVGEAITIHDNRGICSHAGFCSDGLAAVFRAGTEPWIDPDGATAAEIVDVIEK